MRRSRRTLLRGVLPGLFLLLLLAGSGSAAAPTLQLLDRTTIAVDKAGQVSVERTLSFEPPGEAFLQGASLGPTVSRALEEAWRAGPIACSAAPTAGTIHCAFVATLAIEETGDEMRLVLPEDTFLQPLLDALAGYPYALSLQRDIQVDLPGMVMSVPRKTTTAFPLNSSAERQGWLRSPRGLTIHEQALIAPGDLLAPLDAAREPLEISFAPAYRPNWINWLLLVLWIVSLVVAVCIAVPIRRQLILQEHSLRWLRRANAAGASLLLFIGATSVALGLLLWQLGEAALGTTWGNALLYLLPPEVLQTTGIVTQLSLAWAIFSGLVVLVGVAVFLRWEVGRLGAVAVGYLGMALPAVAITPLLFLPLLWAGLPLVAFAVGEVLLGWATYLVAVFHHYSMRLYYRRWITEETEWAASEKARRH